MKEVFYFFECRVMYKSFYDVKISMGNTSTGELSLDFLGDNERILRLLVNAGYKVYPVVLLGSDLLGRICKEYLKKIGCITDYIGWAKEKTDFIFVLQVGEKKQSFYRYIKEKSEEECRQYRRYCEEIIRNRSAVLFIDTVRDLNIRELLAEREDRLTYMVSAEDGLIVGGKREEIDRFAELLRKE